MDQQFEVALFESTGGGLRILGHTTDRAVVDAVRNRLAAERDAEAAELRPVGQPHLIPLDGGRRADEER